MGGNDLVLVDSKGDKLPVPSDADRVATFGREALERAGFTLDHLRKAVSRIDEALDAERVEFFPVEGKGIEEKRTPDHRIRLEAAELVVELADVKPKGKGPTGPTAFNVEIVQIAPDGTETRVRVGGENEPASDLWSSSS
jgi:hypothetical protein